MNQARIGFHPEAVKETEAAVDWYAKRSIRVARRFLFELELALRTVDASPDRWPVLDGNVRRILFRRFPYLLIYRAVGERIEILAVAHGYRRPGYWKTRVD